MTISFFSPPSFSSYHPPRASCPSCHETCFCHEICFYLLFCLSSVTSSCPSLQSYRSHCFCWTSSWHLSFSFSSCPTRSWSLYVFSSFPPHPSRLLFSPSPPHLSYRPPC